MTADTNSRIGIIGGGVSGCTTALLFARRGYETVLFEQKSTLVTGPPFCHLHAGGCFYREIEDDERLELLEQSLQIARVFPETLMRRPTIIAVPKSDPGCPEELQFTFRKVRDHYARLVAFDASNAVLGDPSDYFIAFSKDDIMKIRSDNTIDINAEPSCPRDWMVAFAREVDLEAMQFPVYLTQEIGWNTMKQAAILSLALDKLPQCEVKTSHTVIDVTPHPDVEQSEGFIIQYHSEDTKEVESMHVNYLVNAAGFKTGFIDDIVGHSPRHSAVEFKASYLIQWDHDRKYHWPEVLFHGPRNTPEGMAQFTPYIGGVFQIHGMTNEITLFEDGLQYSPGRISKDVERPTVDLDKSLDTVSTPISNGSSYPTLPDPFLAKINGAWDVEETHARARKSITHLTSYLPRLASAKPVGIQPLFGAQQIPSKNADLRAATCAFVGTSYSRIEIVKAVSAVDAALKVWEHFSVVEASENGGDEANENEENDVDKFRVRATKITSYPRVALEDVSASKIQNRAIEFARSRGFVDDIVC